MVDRENRAHEDDCQEQNESVLSESCIVETAVEEGSNCNDDPDVGNTEQQLQGQFIHPGYGHTVHCGFCDTDPSGPEGSRGSSLSIPFLLQQRNWKNEMCFHNGTSFELHAKFAKNIDLDS